MMKSRPSNVDNNSGPSTSCDVKTHENPESGSEKSSHPDDSGYDGEDDFSSPGSEDDRSSSAESESNRAVEPPVHHISDRDFAVLVDRIASEDEMSRPESVQSLASLVESLRKGDIDLAGVDSVVKRRVDAFRFAQNERLKMYSFRPFGIVGLFSNLSDIRADLRWAEDSTYRREKGKPYISWQDFEAKRNKGMNRPFFTYFLLTASTCMMIVAFYLNHWRLAPLNVNPLVGPNPDVLLRLGALHTQEMIETGSWYRILTAVFLHGGCVHLVLNLAVVALIGRAIERNHGSFQTAILFFVPAVGGNIISGVMQPSYILVGASGGIFGLIGACVADCVLNWKLLFLVFKDRDGRKGCWIRLCCIFWLCFDLVINSAIGFTPFVDNFAHLGGMLYGFLIALTILERLPLSFFGTGSGFCHKLRIASLRFSGAVIAASLICVTIVQLSDSDGVMSPCQKCRYISCAPFPFWSKKKWWYCDGCDAVSGQVFRNRGDAFFSDLSLQCPTTGEIFDIDIFDERLTEQSEVQAALPKYCREYC